MLFSCCNDTIVDRQHREIKIDKHCYEVIIVYCKNCGSMKSSSHIKHIKK